jgi:hypothetical protein
VISPLDELLLSLLRIFFKKTFGVKHNTSKIILVKHIISKVLSFLRIITIMNFMLRKIVVGGDTRALSLPWFPKI